MSLPRCLVCHDTSVFAKAALCSPQTGQPPVSLADQVGAQSPAAGPRFEQPLVRRGQETTGCPISSRRWLWSRVSRVEAVPVGRNRISRARWRTPPGSARTHVARSTTPDGCCARYVMVVVLDYGADVRHEADVLRQRVLAIRAPEPERSPDGVPRTLACPARRSASRPGRAAVPAMRIR